MRQHIREACFELIRKFHQRLSFVNSCPLWSTLSLNSSINVLTASDQSLPAQYRCCQWPPPHPLATAPRTSSAAIADSPGKPRAYAHGTALPSRRSPRNTPSRRAAILPPDKPHPPEPQSPR